MTLHLGVEAIRAGVQGDLGYRGIQSQTGFWETLREEEEEEMDLHLLVPFTRAWLQLACAMALARKHGLIMRNVLDIIVPGRGLGTSVQMRKLGC